MVEITVRLQHIWYAFDREWHLDGILFRLFFEFKVGNITKIRKNSCNFDQEVFTHFIKYKF